MVRTSGGRFFIVSRIPRRLFFCHVTFFWAGFFLMCDDWWSVAYGVLLRVGGGLSWIGWTDWMTKGGGTDEGEGAGA